ncbi:lytic transglycosylase catalytic [Candidatus Moduliflexus flocculans]|uniref:Lytic transglycosylase catalytic n=1 Tax=Candidatus Moduliflexus flocculans TaxID=1499966 RepID=A0A0S6VU45_9BACT|nr:lytic transglycosylase catalytic [Candidatus Moduliflexus flocculans]
MKKRLYGLLLLLTLFMLLETSSRAEEARNTLTDTDLLFQSAYALFAAQNYTEALPRFQQLLRDAPEYILSDYVELYAAESFLQIGEFKKARALLQHLATVVPASRLSADAKFLEADTWFYEKQYTTAIQSYLALQNEKRYRRHDRMPDALLKLGRCYEQTGQISAALELYHNERLEYIMTVHYAQFAANERRLAEQYPAVAAQFYTTDRLFKIIDKLVESGKAQDALLFDEMLRFRQLSVAEIMRAALQRAAILYAMRDNRRAIARYRYFVRDYPDSKAVPFALDRIARLYLRENDMAGFQRIYNQLRKQYPKSQQAASVIYLQGKELELQGRFKEALQEFNVFLTAFPENGLKSEVAWYVGWCHYRLRQYQAAFNAFERFARVYKKSYLYPEALYWAARSAEQINAYSKAAAFYQQLLQSGTRTYFGRLSQQALARLRAKHPNLASSSAAVTEKPLQWSSNAVFTTAAGQRHYAKAETLARLSLHALAAEEFATAVAADNKSAEQYAELARWRLRAGQYNRLARLMRERFLPWILSGGNNVPAEFFRLAYPPAYPAVVNAHADPAAPAPIVYGIMLAESLFDPDVISPAGAIGLMQLMPATGSQLAATLGRATPSFEEYAQPDVNIQLGAAYLKELSRRFAGALPPVIASYNAGEHRVQTWWQPDYAQDIPVFIAMIPYKETRLYVQKVLWYMQEYQEIYR